MRCSSAALLPTLCLLLALILCLRRVRLLVFVQDLRERERERERWSALWVPASHNVQLSLFLFWMSGLLVRANAYALTVAGGFLLSLGFKFGQFTVSRAPLTRVSPSPYSSHRARSRDSSSRQTRTTSTNQLSRASSLLSPAPCRRHAHHISPRVWTAALICTRSTILSSPRQRVCAPGRVIQSVSPP